MSETNIYDSFFVHGVPEKPEPLKVPTKSISDEFAAKLTNKSLEEPYNIHFTINGQIFSSIMEFLNSIDYKVFMVFNHNEIIFIVLAGGDTHMAIVNFEKSELINYEIKRESNKNNEEMIYIDISLIVDELDINENYNIDFYVDTLINNRYYVISGKQDVYRQLDSMNELNAVDSVYNRYYSRKGMLDRVIIKTEYQKVVVSHTSLSNLIKILSKLKSKRKNEVIPCSLLLKKDKLIFSVKNDTKGSNIELSGDDIIVYPIDEDMTDCNIEYFNKFGKLKTTYTTTLYIYKSKLPIIFENRMGEGKILVRYVIAPRVE